MSWLLFICCVFVLLFLMIVAALYVIRPDWLIMDNGVDNPDVDMWQAFVIGLLGAVLGVCFFFLAYYYLHDDC